MKSFSHVFKSNIGKLFKDFLLIFIFVIANVLFCCGIVPFILIMLIAGKIAMLTSADLVEADVRTFFLTIIFSFVFILIKVNFLQSFYVAVAQTNLSSGLYKFLNKFLVNIKFRVCIMILVLLADVIMLFIQYFYAKMDDFGWIVMFLIDCGGVTISYLSFAVFGCRKTKYPQNID